MMTLREFVEKVNCYEHFRVYQPNRDCLIYESYFTVHSPYYFFTQEETRLNDNYWKDNKYNPNVRKTRELDEETKEFLDQFGDYIIFSMECSNVIPRNFKEDNGELKIEVVTDELQPHLKMLNCFNLFIKPQC